ncbi:MAG: penicillin-binding transpeptidase domain-containing protein [bacterium]
MYELKLISKDELDSAKKEVVVFNKNKDDSGIKAPHFVEFVRSYLESRYGREEVETGGLNIITTLDYDLQQKAEETIKEFGDKNEKDFKAKNAGLIATDPKTGQILVMVGSRDYFNTKNEGNFNVTLAHRQPGSSFKPFVYATAFKKGYTPDTVLFDLETEFQANCDPDGNPIPPNNNPNVCYMPQNYDDSFRGPMSLRNALAQSINIPAIKLLYLVGINDAIRTARDLGITGLTNATQYGLTLVLGGGEVTLLDMTNAYSVFANDGIRNPYTPILKITDSTGKTLEEYSNNGIKVLETNVAREISDVLSDYHAKLPAYGENSPLRFDDRQVASKTGTTNDTKDAWVIGFTPNFAMGVWVGNNDNSPMVKKVAGMITAPLWRNFFDKVLKTLPVENFKKPDPIPEDIKPVLRGEWRGGVEYTIDKASGNLATPYTPEELKEKKVLTDVHSILYWVDKKDPLGPAPTDPWSDPQFNNWETSIKKWAEIQGLQSSGTTTAPTGLDNVHGPSLAPKLNILLPDRNRTYGLIETVNINLQVTQTTYPVVQADFFINNTFIGSSKNPPFNFNFLPKEIPQIDYNNEIKVIIYDSIRNSEEMTIPFKVAI